MTSKRPKHIRAWLPTTTSSVGGWDRCCLTDLPRTNPVSRQVWPSQAVNKKAFTAWPIVENSGQILTAKRRQMMMFGFSLKLVFSGCVPLQGGSKVVFCTIILADFVQSRGFERSQGRFAPVVAAGRQRPHVFSLASQAVVWHRFGLWTPRQESCCDTLVHCGAFKL